MADLETVGYSSSECDLLDPSQAATALSDCNRETSIVLCSAIPRRREDSLAAMLKNIEMVHNLCAGIPAAGLRSVVFMSSVDVYGVHLGPGSINEETLVNPRSHYGLSKFASEMLLPIELPSQTPIGILRLPGIYGPRDRTQSVVGGFVDKLLCGESIKITGDGKAKRDYVQVGDLCQVVDHFLRQPFSGVVNIATGVSTAIIDIAMKASELLGKTPAVESVPSTAGEFDLVFDTSKLMRLLPHMRFKDLEQGIVEYAENRSDAHPVSPPAA